MDIDDILGNYKDRYFGAGHRQTRYSIGGVVKRSNNYVAIAKIYFNRQKWSKKRVLSRQYILVLLILLF